MIPSVEEGKNLMLKAHAAVIKRDNPSWTFAKCWTLAQSEHPELKEEFGEQEQETTAATPVPYRYDPAKHVAYTQHFKPAPLPKLDTLLADMRKELDPDRPVRVEARTKGDEVPIKVYGQPTPLW